MLLRKLVLLYWDLLTGKWVFHAGEGTVRVGENF